MTMGLKANADGSGAIQVGGSDAITITSGLVTSINGGVGGLVSGTAVASTSGTSIDFTGIPSWVKRITVMFSGVSLSGTDHILVQIGSGSLSTSGYTSSSTAASSGAATGGVASTSGFIIVLNSASNIIYGHMVITNISSNIWVSSHSVGFATPACANGGGINTNLSGALDRISVTRTGTNTFDAGSINIFYE